MKPISYFRHFLSLAGSSVMAVSSVHAQTGTWNVDSNGTWGTDTNWASNTIADGAGFIANFTNNITADITVSLDTDRTINRVNFADSTTSSAGSWILDNNGTSTNNLILSGTTGAASGTVPVIDVATLGTGKTATISAIIEGSYGFTKSGAGTLVLSGDNTYTGVTTHGASNGIIIVASNNALGSTAVGSHTNITLSNGDNQYIGINNGVNTAENFTISGSSGTGSTAIRGLSGTATLSGTITLAGSGQIRLGNGSGALIWAGTITQSTTSHGLVFYGTNTVSNAMTINGGSLLVANGTVTLNGVNPTDGTGLGDTSIYRDAGTALLVLGVTNALRTDGNLSFSSGAARLNLNGNNQTIKGLIASASTTQEVYNSVNLTTSTLTVGNGGGDYSFGAEILDNLGSGATGTVALIKTGAGNQTLTGINTFTGGTRIDNGTLTLGNAANTLSNTGAINVNGGTLALGVNNDTVGAVTLTSGSITGTGGTLTGSSYAVESGSVSAILGGAGIALTKTTGGTVTLSGANNYGGTTTVSAGKLQITNVAATSATGSGVVNLSGGNTTTLSGTGISTGLLTVTNASRIAAGINTTGANGNFGAAGTLSLGTSGGMTLTSANLDFDLASLTTVGGGVNDLILTGGVMSLTGTEAFTFNLLNATLNTSTAYTLISGASSYSFASGDTSTWITNFVNSSDYTASYSFNGNALQVTFSAVPEPSAALLGALGVLLLLRRRR